MNAFLAAGGGFLVAVIWMDLMFDVLALARTAANPVLPEAHLAQIAGYYRRVTTMAVPMNHLISAVMASMVAILVFQIAHGDGSRTLAAGSLALCGVPILLALVRVFPNAIRLGTRTDSLAIQSRLAHGILVAHILCLVAMIAFVALRIAAAA
jgi:hypothetical protein